jgi:hypothetical protein
MDEAMLKATKKIELVELMTGVFAKKDPKEGRVKINFNKLKVRHWKELETDRKVQLAEVEKVKQETVLKKRVDIEHDLRKDKILKN